MSNNIVPFFEPDADTSVPENLTPSRASKTLSRVFGALIEASGDELKKLPGGSYLVAGAKLLKEISDEEREDAEANQKNQRFDRILSATEATLENTKVIGALAAALYLEQSSVQKLLSNRKIAVSEEEVSDAAKETALLAYKIRVARECREVDRRQVSPMQKQEHVTLLPLDEVYVVPRLVANHDLMRERDEEQELMRQWEDGVPLVHDRQASKVDEVSLRVQRWQSGTRQVGEPAGSAISIVRHAVVLGLPGTGKTTLLTYLARACALGEEAMQERLGWSEETTPLLVSLARFAKTRRDTDKLNLSLKQFITAVIEQLEDVEVSNTALSAAIWDEMAAGRVFLFLDGADEIPNDNDRADIATAIERFLEEYKSIRCLVTSRPAGYHLVRGGLRHYTLPNFTSEQVQEFLRLWRVALAKRATTDDPDIAKAEREADDLFKEIHGNQQVAELATNPLLLVILNLLHVQGTRPPERRVDLYERVVEMLAGQWNELRSRQQGVELRTGLNTNDLIEVLAAVAEWMRREKPRGIVHRDELEHKMAEIIEDRVDGRHARALAITYLDAAANKSGLLTECGYDYFMFWHSTIEEYLTARELSNPAATTKDRLLPLRGNSRYHEVILLAVAHVAKRERTTGNRLVEGIWLDEPDTAEPLFHHNLVLAAECIVDQVNIRPELKQRIFAALLDAVEAHPFEDLVQTFQRLCYSSSTVSLIDQDVCLKLHRMSGAIHLYICFNYEQERVMGAIAYLFSLALKNVPEAITYYRDVRDRILVSTNDEGLPTALISAAENAIYSGHSEEKDWQVVFQYPFDINEIAECVGRNVVIEKAKQFLSASGREYGALYSLFILRELSQVESHLNSEVENTTSNQELLETAGRYAMYGMDAKARLLFIDLLKSDDVDIRIRAALSLDGYDEALEVLSALVTNDVHNKFATSICVHLLRAQRRDVVDRVLEKWSKSNQEDQRLNAAQILEHTGRDEEAATIYRELVTTKNLRTRVSVAHGFIRVKNHDEATAVLSALLNNLEDEVSGDDLVTFIRILIDNGKQNDCVPYLIKALEQAPLTALMEFDDELPELTGDYADIREKLIHLCQDGESVADLQAVHNKVYLSGSALQIDDVALLSKFYATKNLSQETSFARKYLYVALQDAYESRVFT